MNKESEIGFKEIRRAEEVEIKKYLPETRSEFDKALLEFTDMLKRCGCGGFVIGAYEEYPSDSLTRNIQRASRFIQKIAPKLKCEAFYQEDQIIWDSEPEFPILVLVKFKENK